ncbi:MAG: hypothetical protein ACM3X4_01975 [Ignavibacteriales bacterium]
MAATRGVKYTKRPYKAFAVPAFAIVATLAALTRAFARSPAGTLKIPVIVVEAFPACSQGQGPETAEGTPFVCLQEGDDSSAMEIPPGCRWAMLVADGTGGRFLARWLYAGWRPALRASLGEGAVSREIVAVLLPGGRALVVPGGRNNRQAVILSPGESWGDVIAGAAADPAGDTVIRAHNLGRIGAVVADRDE